MSRTSYELAAARELRQLTVLYMRRHNLSHTAANNMAARVHREYIRGVQWAVNDVVAARDLAALPPVSLREDE